MPKKKKKRRKKSKKLVPNLKNKTKPNLFGPENLKILPKKNMPISINHYQMIGKNIWLLNNSQSKVNSNSEQFSLSPKELPLICLKLKKKKITSNYMLEESLLWMIVKN